jgi:hypothetical protein
MSKLLFMSWCVILVQTIAPCSNFINSWKFQEVLPKSIEFQTLNLPWFLIQILPQILKSSNKENCSLFDSLQIHILFEIFGVRKVHLLIKSIQTHLKIIWINKKYHYSFRPTQSNWPMRPTSYRTAPQCAPPLPPLCMTAQRCHCPPPSPDRTPSPLDFFSSSLWHRSRPSALVSPFLFHTVLSKMKCIGVTPSIHGCLVSTPGHRHTTRSRGFETTSPPIPCSRWDP